MLYRISVFRINLEKYLGIEINYYRIQGLELSYIAEMNITFTKSLDFITYKHYMEQSMPMVERVFNIKLYKSYELTKTLDDIALTLHMGAYEHGSREVYDSTDEGEYLHVVKYEQ